MAIYIITGMLINKSLYRNASSSEAKIPESDNDYDGVSNKITRNITYFTYPIFLFFLNDTLPDL